MDGQLDNKNGRLIQAFLLLVTAGSFVLACVVSPFTARWLSKTGVVAPDRLFRIGVVETIFLGIALVSFLGACWVARRKQIHQGWLIACLVIGIPCGLVFTVELLLVPKYSASYGILDPFGENQSLFARPDRELGHVLNSEYRGDYCINRLGLRGINEPKAKRGFRILCLGDSITFGWKLGEKDAYPVLFEKHLRKTGWRGDVINAAVPSYTSRQAVVMARRWCPVFKPDLLLVCVGWNDLSYSFNQRWSENLCLCNPFRKQFQPAIFKCLAHVSSRRGVAASPYRATPDPRAMPFFEKNLEQVVLTAKENGVRLVLLPMPTILAKDAMTDEEKRKAEFYADKGEFFAGFNAIIRKIGTRYQIPVVENFFDLAEKGKGGWFMDNCHFTPSGAQEAAMRIAAGVSGVVSNQMVLNRSIIHTP